MNTFKMLIEAYAVALVLVVVWNYVLPALFDGQTREGHELSPVLFAAAAILGLARGITYSNR